jgi:hypothetical protein
MKIVVVMTTANRAPRENYAAQTIGMLAAQGVRPVVFATDPDVRWLAPSVRVACDLRVPTRRLTRIENGAAALLGAPECDWVLHLEDDAKPCDDALGSVQRWLGHHAREDRRLVLFWSRDTYEGVASGAADHSIGRLFGGVAVAMRMADAVSLGTWAARHARRWRSGTARLRGFDKMMAQWHREAYPEIAFVSASVPSLFQHIGKQSSLSHLSPHGGFWTSPTFTGRAYA